MYTKLSIATIIALSGVASAGINSIDGGVIKITPNYNDPIQGYGQADYVQGFTELTNVTLANDVTIQLGDGSAGVLSAGTVVNSHLVYFDPDGTLNWGVSDVNIEFDQTILGLIVNDQEMLNTNSQLGLNYLNYTPTRGLQNYGPNGQYDIETFNGSTLNVSLRGVEGDYFRVLTTVPTPGSLALIGGAALIGLRRQRN